MISVLGMNRLGINWSGTVKIRSWTRNFTQFQRIRGPSGSLRSGFHTRPHPTKSFTSATSVTGLPSLPRTLATSSSSSSPSLSPSPTAPQLSFPCLDRLEQKTQDLQNSCYNENINSLNGGPEPFYSRVHTGFETFKSSLPIFLDYGGYLPEYELAYESWGKLNDAKTNLILLHTGLSASSHAKSHSSNSKPGWWEDFIGPGKYLDTDKYFIVCTNVLGGCYGSTGPSSINPLTGTPYGTTFPILSINDMVRAQRELVRDEFGVSKLFAAVGASMGGMQSLAFGHEFPDEVEKVVSISACARSSPSSIALRHTQRQVLMSDPNWKRGFYYDKVPPHVGMKLAREIATITYRSGPEWDTRFGRKRADEDRPPALCPDFLVETYLDHAGEKFCLEYDANSFLYVLKAMDLFDLGHGNRTKAQEVRRKSLREYHETVESLVSKKSGPQKVALTTLSPETLTINTQSETLGASTDSSSCSSKPPYQSLPSEPYKEKVTSATIDQQDSFADLVRGMETLADKDVLVIGVESDALFPSRQQQEIHRCLKESAGRGDLRYAELSTDISVYGHDTFLLSLDHIGGPVRDFLTNRQ